MIKTNFVIAIIILVILLSIGVFSQLIPTINIISSTKQITPDISLEENQICKTEFYDETHDLYGSCIFYYNYTSCLNTSGANTDCSLQQDLKSFQCKTGEETVLKNKTECKPDNKFIISINNGSAVLKKQIDYSEWGPCIYSQESINGNSCLVVTCVSLYDGAHKGQFTDCNGGKSCERFEICGNNIKKFYKNSRADFSEEDSSFYLNRLDIDEVAR